MREYSIYLRTNASKYQYMAIARAAGAIVTNVSGCGPGYYIEISATPAQVGKIEKKLEEMEK